MSKNISLCITYIYHDYQNNPKPSVYRIADYIDGEYFPVDSKRYSEDGETFSPRYLRTRPGDETDYYVPVLREWKAVPKYDEPGKMTTESFPYIHGEVYEVIYNRENIESDPVVLQKRIKDGIRLPDGIGSTFLLVLDEDEQSFTVAKCRKSMVKRFGELFYFDTNITDMLHSNHYLDTYIIEKSDVFNTSDFSGFYKEDRTSAETRYFYRFDCLPEVDGRFYLHELSDYIPFFVSRFLKKEGKKYELSKNQIQKVTAAVEEAVTSKEAIDSFFAVTGFNLDEVIEQLPRYYREISTSLYGYDDVDAVLSGMLVNDENIREQFIEIARDMWFKDADEKREEVDKQLAEVQKRLEACQVQLDTKIRSVQDAEAKRSKLDNEILSLQRQKELIEAAAIDSVKSIDSTLGAKLVDYAFLKHMGIGTTRPEKEHIAQLSKNAEHRYPALECPNGVKRTNETSKAIAVLKANLKKAGMKSYYAEGLAAIIHAVNYRARSFVVSGMYARTLADAICNSTEGRDATRITITGAQSDYSYIREIIEGSPVRVILVENLLDYCDEATFSMLGKDFGDYILVYSVDNEDSLAVMSKGIWQMATYINADDAMESFNRTADFMPAVVENLSGKIDVNYRLDGYADLNKVLRSLGLSVFARANLIGLMRFFDDNYKVFNPVRFMDSTIAKFCSIYTSSVPDEVFSDIVDSLPDDLADIYFEQ